MFLDIHQAKLEAAHKAVDSLSRYKFIMFGYHAALWVSLNRLDATKDHNPFIPLVHLARRMLTGFL